MKKDLLDIEYWTNVDSAKLTTMKVHATIKAVFYPKNEQEITFLYDFFSINEIPFIILGNGSNIVFTKNAEKLIVISTKKMKQKIIKKDNFVMVSSSVMLSKLYRFCQENGLSGFEKLAGIPATIGGALHNNAGCFGASITDNLIAVKIFQGGKTYWINKEKLNLSYRNGIKNCLILSAKFACTKQDKCKIEQEFLKYLSIRAQKQPKGFNSGSVFKNMPTYHAGELIDKCGLKGLTQGGAKISEKHANFIINFNHATSDDILKLIDIVQSEVFNKYGFMLEKEIEIY